MTLTDYLKSNGSTIVMLGIINNSTTTELEWSTELANLADNFWFAYQNYAEDALGEDLAFASFELGVYARNLGIELDFANIIRQVAKEARNR